MSLTGKIALVTGASRGIGKAIAELLGQAGARVIGTATTAAGAEQLSAYFAEQAIQGQGLVLDVSSIDSVTQAFKTMQEKIGDPLIVVNNAGVVHDNIMLRMKEEEWDTVINTNLNSIYRITKAALRGMTKARWGRIVSIGSVIGATGNIGQANYAAAKAGIAGFSKALAREIGSRNITVNVVAPGFIDTDMTKHLPQAQTQVLLSQIPLARLGAVQEVAAAVKFLVSDDAAYITGQTIHVNGGLYMN